MNRRLFPWLLVLPVLVMSCSKKVTSPVTFATPKPDLHIEEIDFEYLHGKARMILRDASKEREVKANIRIHKDSVIWMSFSVIGVQGGKALINKDSITILSNIDKEYFVFEYAELSRRYNFNVNYQVVQDALLGNLIVAPSESDEITKESSFFRLKQQTGAVVVENLINAASMKIEKVEMKEPQSNNSLTLNYSNFQPVGDKLFPYNGTVNIFYKAPSGALNTTIIFEYNKAEVGDKELKFPFNIPKKYVRR